MSWLFEAKRYPSEKNGFILCRKFLGRWWVFVESYDQSSPYIKRMWRAALRRVPLSSPVSRVLLLGLGAGSIVDDLYEKYPGAEVAVIEYDPVMVKVCREVKLFTHEPTIILEDAVTAVPKLNGLFDLVIVDLYRGGKTASILEQPAFIASISSKLSPNGTLVLNAFENTALFPLFDQHFSRKATWQFSYNALALYKKVPADA